MMIHEAGDRAVLVEYENLFETMAHYRALAANTVGDVEDVVPAARTILVRHNGNRDRVAAWVRAVDPDDDASVSEAEPVVIPVTYDGDDLDDVAEATGLTTDEVITEHTGQIWTVAFGGFAPGFGYLVGENTRLQVPRRQTPRTTVPAGAVGLAGEFSGIYPRSSPGGWQLIGTTEVPLWNVEREPPALLQPGITVRFEQR